MKDHPSQWITSGLTCRDVADRATDYLDERLPILTQVRCGLHLASCAHCRVYMKQLALVSACARLVPSASIPALNRLHLRRYFSARHRGTAAVFHP